MKTSVFALLLVLTAFCSFAERELSLGEYAADTRERVVSKIREALEGHFGLEGMKQRARRIGASVRFERRGKGMVLILEKRA